jgi:cobalt-zinc-cadmium efflux system protein
MALALTSAILVAEVVGGFISNSLALLADAGHMLTDVLALALAYVALGLATRPATPHKTYGWYRIEILAALINGVTLVVIALVIFWEAYGRFKEPPEVATVTMLAIATIGLVANAVGIRFLSGHGHSLNLRGAYLHMLGDLLSSVGVIIGGLIMWQTGNFVVDPLLSAAIGVVIIVSAYRLLRESVDVLLEGTPVGLDLGAVEEALRTLEGVEGVHDLHVWSLTSGVNALSCHVEVKAEALAGVDAILDRIRSLLQERFEISHTTIQIESESYKQRGLVYWNLEKSGEGE